MPTDANAKTLAASGIDLAARVLDLTKVLSTASSSTAGGLIEIGQWLAYERVNVQDLYDCFSKARDIAFGNASVHSFYDIIAKPVPTKLVWPLAVQQSGALGRIMIRDPHLQWFVSTTACLMQFHDDRETAEAICMMIMAPSVLLSQDTYPFTTRNIPARLELKAVVDKIVPGIWFNIVNSGTNVEGLPDELQSVCSRGHQIEPDQLRVLIEIMKVTQGKVVLETRYQFQNLALWLLRHWHGSLLISVSGKLLFERCLGDSPAIIELKVQTFCNEDDDCSKNEKQEWHLYSDIKGSLADFFSSWYSRPVENMHSSITRKSLYDTTKSYNVSVSALPSQTKTMASQSAQLMINWLLSRRIRPNRSSPDF